MCLQRHLTLDLSIFVASRMIRVIYIPFDFDWILPRTKALNERSSYNITTELTKPSQSIRVHISSVSNTFVNAKINF